MSEAVRIQRKRTKGWRMPEGAVYVGRGSVWGNPWIVDPERATNPPRNQYRSTPHEVVDLFRAWLTYPGVWHCGSFTSIDQLRGHDLACWCPLDQPCHADVLLEIANAAAFTP